MGKVRTNLVKKSAKVLVEKYYSRLTTDFQGNKKLTAEVTIMPSKRVRNKVAGYVTKLMKRIGKGPVRGISLKLQEEERERRLDFVPEIGTLDMDDKIVVDKSTSDMLQSIGVSDIKRVVVESSTKSAPQKGRREKKA